MKPSLERVTKAYLFLMDNGFDDVAPLLQKRAAEQIQDERPRRKRGVKVRLLGGRVNATLDAERVAELMAEATSVEES